MALQFRNLGLLNGFEILVRGIQFDTENPCERFQVAAPFCQGLGRFTSRCHPCERLISQTNPAIFGGKTHRPDAGEVGIWRMACKKIATLDIFPRHVT